MGGYTPQDMKPPSWLSNSGLAAAAQQDGTLVGVFTVQMPTPASAFPPSAFPFLYVFGPLDKHGSPALHEVRSDSFLNPPPHFK